MVKILCFERKSQNCNIARGTTRLGSYDLARLAGVSDQAVVNWESNEKKIAFRRKETGIRLAELRAMNKRTVAEELNKPKSR